MSGGRKQFFGSTRIAALSMLSACAGILYIFNFAMPFAFPSFLEFNLADIPALIGSFAMGPVSGGIIVAVRILIKLVVKSTSTAFVGELSDLFTGCAFVMPAGLIYSKNRTVKGALIGIGVGAAAEIVLAVLLNFFLLVPFYVWFFFKGKWEPLVKMMTPLFPSCTKESFYSYYIWLSVLPFNMLRCIVAAGVTIAVYKRISVIINRLNDKLALKHESDGEKMKKIYLASIIAASALIVIAVIVIVLHYFKVI